MKEGCSSHEQQSKPQHRAVPISGDCSAAELEAIKARQRATWASGDYSVHRHHAADRRRVAVRGRRPACGLEGPGRGGRQWQLLAGGSSALRRGHVDRLRPELLEDGRRRAEADRLPIMFQEADAEALPFADESFDVVLSSFGVMFTPNHVPGGPRARACLPRGGRIGLANWTPRGFIGRLFAVVSHYAHRQRRSRRRRDGERRITWTSCSAHQRPTSTRPVAISCFGIVRRNTGSTCFKPGTARCTRRSAVCPSEGQHDWSTT